MPAPHNRLKSRLLSGETTYGCWLGMTSSYVAEVAGSAGFDWLMIDAEHCPNAIPDVLRQLQVLQNSPSDVAVRLPASDDWLIKQALDIGAQTLLIPMVDTVEEARAIAAATRYPPEGRRGAGAALARASAFADIPDYISTANAEICVIIQIESARAHENLDELLAVEGIDGYFVGPSDLSADMGYPGQGDAEPVRAAIADILRRGTAAGQRMGILAISDEDIAFARENGATMLGIGLDLQIYKQAMHACARRFVSD